MVPLTRSYSGSLGTMEFFLSITNYKIINDEKLGQEKKDFWISNNNLVDNNLLVRKTTVFYLLVSTEVHTQSGGGLIQENKRNEMTRLIQKLRQARYVPTINNS